MSRGEIRVHLKRKKKNEQKCRERNAQNWKKMKIFCDAISSIDMWKIPISHTQKYVNKMSICPIWDMLAHHDIQTL